MEAVCWCQSWYTTSHWWPWCGWEQRLCSCSRSWSLCLSALLPDTLLQFPLSVGVSDSCYRVGSHGSSTVYMCMYLYMLVCVPLCVGEELLKKNYKVTLLSITPPPHQLFDLNFSSPSIANASCGHLTDCRILRPSHQRSACELAHSNSTRIVSCSVQNLSHDV